MTDTHSMPDPYAVPPNQRYQGPNTDIRKKPTAADREPFFAALREAAREKGRPLTDAEFAAVAALFT
jgi:hypothetical protein